ncbi:MAG TPA: cupin-like domain-containing protein, partial [Sphingomonas sp.]
MTGAGMVQEWRGVTRETFEKEIRPSGRPALLRALAADWPATQAALRSDEALVEHVAAFDAGRPLSTYVGAPSIKGRFFYREDVRGFNFDRGQASFLAVARKLLADRASGSGPAIYTGAAAADEFFPGFAQANRMPLLDGVMPRLWIGNAVTISTHYDVA